MWSTILAPVKPRMREAAQNGARAGPRRQRNAGALVPQTRWPFTSLLFRTWTTWRFVAAGEERGVFDLGANTLEWKGCGGRGRCSGCVGVPMLTSVSFEFHAVDHERKGR